MNLIPYRHLYHLHRSARRRVPTYYVKHRFDTKFISHESSKAPDDDSERRCPVNAVLWRPLFALDRVNATYVALQQKRFSQTVMFYFCAWKICKDRGMLCSQTYSLRTFEDIKKNKIDLYHPSGCACDIDGKKPIEKRMKRQIDGTSKAENDDETLTTPCPDMARSLYEPRAVIAESPFKYKFVEGMSGKAKGPLGDKNDVLEWQSRLIDSVKPGITQMPTSYANYMECSAHRHTMRQVVAAPCQFPFKYHGITHNACIRHDDTQYWCPHKLDDNRNYIGGYWGYCSASCPIELFECRTVYGGPEVGAICAFPFTYRETQFWKCTSVDSERPWCATEVDKHGYFLENKWGICDCMDGEVIHTDKVDRVDDQIGADNSTTTGDTSTVPASHETTSSAETSIYVEETTSARPISTSTSTATTTTSSVPPPIVKSDLPESVLSESNSVSALYVPTNFYFDPIVVLDKE